MKTITGEWSEKATLDIPCPDCNHQTTELISKLQKDKSAVCAGCGKTIAISSDALDRLKALDKVIKGFRK